jgi:hypothetical protein
MGKRFADVQLRGDGEFLFFRADNDNEIWVIAPKDEGGKIYLCDTRPLLWKAWSVGQNRGIKRSAIKPRELERGYCFEGKLDAALADLRKIGIEEKHLDKKLERVRWHPDEVTQLPIEH